MEDLISYSFQVARGMEFLSSRKVSLALYCLLLCQARKTFIWTHTHLCYKSIGSSQYLLNLWQFVVMCCHQQMPQFVLIGLRSLGYQGIELNSGGKKTSPGFRLDECGDHSPPCPLASFQNWPESQNTQLHRRASVNTSQWGPPRKLQLVPIRPWHLGMKGWAGGGAGAGGGFAYW